MKLFDRLAMFLWIGAGIGLGTRLEMISLMIPIESLAEKWWQKRKIRFPRIAFWFRRERKNSLRIESPDLFIDSYRFFIDLYRLILLSNVFIDLPKIRPAG